MMLWASASVQSDRESFIHIWRNARTKASYALLARDTPLCQLIESSEVNLVSFSVNFTTRRHLASAVSKRI